LFFTHRDPFFIILRRNLTENSCKKVAVCYLLKVVGYNIIELKNSFSIKEGSMKKYEG